MATNGDPSMISPPSSISNGPEPQLPPLPPPLRSTQVLQPLCVYPVSTLSQEGTYDYVFSGPLDSQALSSTLKLTSPPVRVRPDVYLPFRHAGPPVYRSQSIDSQRSSGVDDGRSSTGTRHSPGSGLKRTRYIGDGTGSLGSRKSDRCDGEDAESLRQLLIDTFERLLVRAKLSNDTTGSPCFGSFSAKHIMQFERNLRETGANHNKCIAY